MRKRVITLALALALAIVPVITVSAEVMSANNQLLGEVSTSATVHNSKTWWQRKNGEYGYCNAYTWDGSNVYYIEAEIEAKYSNGAGQGPKDMKYKKNHHEVETDKVYENGAYRQYFGSSKCKNTSSSSYEYRSGKSPVFK